jgi:hypothetical protein
MKTPGLAILALVGSCALPVAAGPGDVYVPAHRTGDGHWVPANVPPSSGGTRMARKLPARSTARTAPPVTPPAAPSAAPAMPPLLLSAEPIRR